jgi:hypothetical protein
MNSLHSLVPAFLDRRTSTVPLPEIGGGLRLLLKGGLLPKGVESLQFVCDLDEARETHITVVALHKTDAYPTCEIANELRMALESCFLRFLNRMRPSWGPTSGHADIWEWSASRPNSLRHRRRRREVYPAPP